MSKGKLQKFAEMETFPNVFQFPYSVAIKDEFPLKGKRANSYFKNNNPIILELGCGKGEYTVGLGKMFPNINFIGVDIKGSRMHKGAKEALACQLSNVAFLRTNIEIIDRFFDSGEVNEIWLTFSDPQMKNARKRLTSTYFMERYRQFLTDNGIIHLKTDSPFLYKYTNYMIENNHLPLLYSTENLYSQSKNFKGEIQNRPNLEILGIHTYYEDQWLSRGMTIKYIKFCLPQQGDLEEPNVEIDLDDYRSYHRQKRSGLKTSR